VDEDEVDLGPIDNVPEGTFVIATYLANPQQGEVSRRTAFVRNNGFADSGEPSFTILYSRCVHLGCPVQPNGPIDEAASKQYKDVQLLPVLAQSFGCPCHGGLYDAEGNRRAGPPVRSMDRYSFSIRNGRLVLGELYAVGNVNGTGAGATISKYPWSTPGTHVDGIEAWLYPIVPSQVTG
jgi:Rieske Fe-S protein